MLFSSTLLWTLLVLLGRMVPMPDFGAITEWRAALSYQHLQNMAISWYVDQDYEAGCNYQRLHNKHGVCDESLIIVDPLNLNPDPASDSGLDSDGDSDDDNDNNAFDTRFGFDNGRDTNKGYDNGVDPVTTTDLVVYTPPPPSPTFVEKLIAGVKLWYPEARLAVISLVDQLTDERLIEAFRPLVEELNNTDFGLPGRVCYAIYVFFATPVRDHYKTVKGWDVLANYVMVKDCIFNATSSGMAKAKSGSSNTYHGLAKLLGTLNSDASAFYKRFAANSVEAHADFMEWVDDTKDMIEDQFRDWVHEFPGRLRANPYAGPIIEVIMPVIEHRITVCLYRLVELGFLIPYTYTNLACKGTTLVVKLALKHIGIGLLMLYRCSQERLDSVVDWYELNRWNLLVCSILLYLCMIVYSKLWLAKGRTLSQELWDYANWLWASGEALVEWYQRPEVQTIVRELWTLAVTIFWVTVEIAGMLLGLFFRDVLVPAYRYFRHKREGWLFGSSP